GEQILAGQADAGSFTSFLGGAGDGASERKQRDRRLLARAHLDNEALDGGYLSAAALPGVMSPVVFTRRCGHRLGRPEIRLGDGAGDERGGYPDQDEDDGRDLNV